MSKKLSQLQQREILKELWEREQALVSRKVASRPSEADLEKAQNLLSRLFPQQRDFFFDSASQGRYRVARCTRRAGKTTGAAIKLLYTLVMDPRSVGLYVAKSTTIVRDQIWPELKTLVAEHDLPFEFNETQLRIAHKKSTGRIIFRGASDAAQLDKLRGLGVGGSFVLSIMDESGTFGSEMEQLVSSVISPGLRDRGGEMLLIGTPGYYPEGLFYEASEGLRPNWVRRRWTLQDNPFISDDAKNYDLIKLEEGLTEDDPVFIREWKGEYAINLKTQMFDFDPARNRFTTEPADNLTYFLGVDFGWVDETAIVALGWSHFERKMYAVESWAASEQTSDMVADQLQRLISKYRPTRIIGDVGGYGKGPAEQIWSDYKIYIEPAVKTEKLNHVEFMNSAFRRGDLLVRYNDELARELPKVLWAENKRDAHNKAKDNRSFALMYAWRAANSIAGRAANPVAPHPDTDGWPNEEIEAKLALSEPKTATADWYLRDDF